jgi:TatA/E family protein of Tat protein translocase
MTANLFGPDLGYVVLVIVVVLLFGSQLPKIARNIGIAGKEFRKAQHEAEAEEAERKSGAAGALPASAAAATAPPVASPPPSVEVPAGTGAPAAAARASAGEQITMTKAELDALLRQREEQARREAAGPPSN